MLTEPAPTYLVCIDHEYVTLVVANDISCNSQPLLVFFHACSNLELEVPVTLGQRLLKQTLHLVLAVP